MDKIDATIGKSIRHYRWLQGVSQADLASTLGISEAQIRSHEAGKSRVSAARLMAIAGHLGVDVTAFFHRNPDAATPPVPCSPATLRGGSDAVQSGKYLAALMTHFQRLNDTQKQAVLQLVVSISKEGAGLKDALGDVASAARPQAATETQTSVFKPRELAEVTGRMASKGGRDGPY